MGRKRAETATPSTAVSSRKQSPPSASSSAKGIRQMDAEMQRKLSHGVAFNMKIVIRGASATGKSSLLRRLDGAPFETRHVTTAEIDIATIDWSYKTSPDTIKLEIWDVVDRAPDGSSADAEERDIDDDTVAGSATPASRPRLGSHKVGALDAETVDVYAGAHAVVFVMDPTRASTLAYVKRRLAEIEPSTPVLLIANFVDLWSGEAAEGERVAGHEVGRRSARA
jgi:GTPase SAR1 family protein